jgi:signal transduction histidine kinase
VRAKFFDALSGFQGELRPDAESQAVLRRSDRRRSACWALRRRGFSLPPDQDYAEVLMCDEAAKVFEPRWSIAPSVRRSPPRPGDGPVMAAAMNLEWLSRRSRRGWWASSDSGFASSRRPMHRRRDLGRAGGESQRLGPQAQELCAIANGWALALRTAQIREEAARSPSNWPRPIAEFSRPGGNPASRTMISVGEMAAGAAHEMNNPLAVISGRSQLLAAAITDPKHKAMAHLIHEQAIVSARSSRN